MARLQMILLFAFTTCCISLTGQSAPDTLNGDYVQSIMDSIILSNMDEYNVPGVTYAVVNNDRVL